MQRGIAGDGAPCMPISSILKSTPTVGTDDPVKKLILDHLVALLAGPVHRCA